jgi:hypothetical protein
MGQCRRVEAVEGCRARRHVAAVVALVLVGLSGRAAGVLALCVLVHCNSGMPLTQASPWLCVRHSIK